MKISKREKKKVVPKREKKKTIWIAGDYKEIEKFGKIIKHKVNYEVPQEIFVSHLEHSGNITERIRSNNLIKDYSYFYAEIPFSVVPMETNYMVPTITLDASFLARDENLAYHIASYFPPDNFKEIGKEIKDMEVKGNFAIKIPALKNLAPIMGLGLGTGLDIISGFQEWSNSTIKKVDYRLSVPKVIAGSNGNNNVVWTFFQNKVVGEHGQYKPTVIFGLSKAVHDSEIESNRLLLEFELTLGSKMVAKHKIPIRIVQLA